MHAAPKPTPATAEAPPGAPAARKPRADATRNRERLLEIAKLAFTEAGADVSLDEIARRAGVGIGTLYRHFPTRGAMIAAVYRRPRRRLFLYARHSRPALFRQRRGIHAEPIRRIS